MRSIVKLISILLGFLTLFELARLLFLWTSPEGRQLAPGEWGAILRAAFPMDLAAISIVFTVFLLTAVILKSLNRKGEAINEDVRRNRILFQVLGFIIILICTLDLRMFRYWGFHIDREFLSYLITPKEALASVSVGDVGIFTLLMAVQLAFLIFLSRVLFRKGDGNTYPSHRISWKTLLICLPILFVLIRGGIGPTTMNQARVYHSPKPFNNLAAINPVWNFIYSYTIDPLNTERYQFMEFAEAQDVLAGGLPGRIARDSLLDQGACKNLILIVLESFTAQAIQSISGINVQCTPAFDHATQNGILFTQHFASGDRSAESLVTLFTGFPAFTRVDVLDDPKRLRNLPHLYRELGEKGYQTLFEYGGDLNFANMNALIREGQTSSIVDISSFDPQAPGNQWGVHDAIVFQDFLERTSSLTQPFAAGVFSLSSHEPYRVPYPDHFTGENAAFFNALHYTDSCLGVLLGGIEKSSFYDSTLVLITADHGNRQPGNWNLLHPNKFHTPLLLWGGPVKRPARIDYPVSQVAIAPQLAQLYELNWPEPIVQADLFDSACGAFYAYNDGGGYIHNKERSVYDVAMQKCVEGSSQSCRMVQAYLQFLATRMEELSTASDRTLQP